MEIPVELELVGHGRRRIKVPLPPELKPGKYRVFVRARFGGVKVGDSYAWITELSGPSVPERK